MPQYLYLVGCSAAAAAPAKSLQSCRTLCDPIDGSPPGSPAPGVLQARTLEWVTEYDRADDDQGSTPGKQLEHIFVK